MQNRISKELTHSTAKDASSSRRAFVIAGLGMAVAASLLTLGASSAHAQQVQQAQQQPANTPTANAAEQEVRDLSKQKWLWMAERKVDELDALFHEDAVFVHMGGAMSKSQELDTIRSGRIQYKDAQIAETTVRVIGPTAIVLDRMRLVAVVGGNEVTNPFMVTSVYVRQGDAWKLAQLSFTRTMGN